MPECPTCGYVVVNGDRIERDENGHWIRATHKNSSVPGAYYVCSTCAKALLLGDEEALKELDRRFFERDYDHELSPEP